MGLSQSLYTGYSGLHTHQKSMDTIGNNLANANTTGFKNSQYLFNSLFKQALNTGGIPANGDRSATNPKALGMGVTTGTIATNFRQGAPEETKNPLDCALVGNGFFMVATRGGIALTRNGSFYTDNVLSSGQRMLCAGEGLPVQGWNGVNGVITPSTTVGNIYLPAIGDRLPGKITSEVLIQGILPTNTGDADFAGAETTSMELSGNLAGDGTSFRTSIYAGVTRTTDGTPEVKDDIQEIPVQIQFHGPTVSADGAASAYSWTMTTVDWPNPGDPGVQVYPSTEDPEGVRSGMSFYTGGSADLGHGAGQAVSDVVSTGPSEVAVSRVNADGTVTETSFAVPGEFALDISKLTNLPNSPTGDGVEAWHVNGNPTGTMARTVTVFDAYNGFEGVNGVMQPVRMCQARPDTLFFSRTGSDDTGTDWRWESSAGGAGTIRFDTHGELASSRQSAGAVAYSFADLRNIAHSGQITAIDQNGYRDGQLEDFVIDQNGTIWGTYSNDHNEALARIAVGTVPNVDGMSGSSGTLFYPNTASGGLMIGVAGDAAGALGLAPIGAGTIRAGALESSNVDMSREFTNLIQTERGYQFNSRIITTADQMLQTALQLK